MASAPGKTILMGEHAVVYGAPAMVAAVTLRARAVVEPAPDVPPGRIAVHLTDLEHRGVHAVSAAVDYARDARDRWEEYRRRPDRSSFREMLGDGPDHVALVALGQAEETARRHVETPPASGDGLRLEVGSEIPVGRGFGSSAAVGACVAAAWLARRGVDLGTEEMEELLLDVERRQHGDPSGVDAAAVLRGGLVWGEPDADGLDFRPVADRGGVLDGFLLADTGEPAESTGEVVSAVRERRDRDPGPVEAALGRVREATVAFRRLLDATDPEPAEVVRLVRRCQRGLEEIGVVPAPVREIVRAVEARGGAAKISGAGALSSPEGGPAGGGLLLVYHPEPGRVGAWPCMDDAEILDVGLGAEGLRREDGR